MLKMIFSNLNVWFHEMELFLYIFNVWFLHVYFIAYNCIFLKVSKLKGMLDFKEIKMWIFEFWWNFILKNFQISIYCHILGRKYNFILLINVSNESNLPKYISMAFLSKQISKQILYVCLKYSMLFSFLRQIITTGESWYKYLRLFRNADLLSS